MRFLVALYKYFPWAGLQKDTLRILKEACARGHEVVLLTTSWEGPPPPEGVTLEKVTCRGWSNHARMLDFQHRFQDLQKRTRFDASLAMNRIPGGDFYFVADTCIAKAMPAKHWRITLALLPRYRVFLRQEAEICDIASPTTLLYIAEAQKRDYQEVYKLHDERLQYIPPGMDPRCMKPQNADDIRARKRQELKIAPQELLIVSVGTGLWGKGIDRAMRAVASLLRRGIQAHYLLVGNDSEKKVQQLAKSCGISDHFTFLRGRDDVPELLLAADLMLHPAREEGAGAVIVEALASGLPVICTEECGFSPFVQEATDTVVPAPFVQGNLEKMLEGQISNLQALAGQSLAYAQSHDFCGRARVIVDCLEQKGREKSGQDGAGVR